MLKYYSSTRQLVVVHMKLLVTRKVIVSDMQINVSDTYTSYHGCFDKGINNGDCQT